MESEIAPVIRLGDRKEFPIEDVLDLVGRRIARGDEHGKTGTALARIAKASRFAWTLVLAPGRLSRRTCLAIGVLQFLIEVFELFCCSCNVLGYIGISLFYRSISSVRPPRRAARSCASPSATPNSWPKSAALWHPEPGDANPAVPKSCRVTVLVV